MRHPFLNMYQTHAVVYQFYTLCMTESVEFKMI